MYLLDRASEFNIMLIYATVSVYEQKNMLQEV